MYAAYKGSIVKYVTFEGYHVDYPVWFTSEIVSKCYIDEYGYTQYPVDEADDTLVEGYDTFVMNNRGDIRKIAVDAFEDYYTDLGMGYAAPTSECIEYYEFNILHNNRFGHPKWIREMLNEGIVTSVNGCVMFYDHTGEIAVSPSCVFLRNRTGDVVYLESEKFDEVFYSPHFYLDGYFE